MNKKLIKILTTSLSCTAIVGVGIGGVCYSTSCGSSTTKWYEHIGSIDELFSANFKYVNHFGLNPKTKYATADDTDPYDTTYLSSVSKDLDKNNGIKNFIAMSFFNYAYESIFEFSGFDNDDGTKNIDEVKQELNNNIKDFKYDATFGAIHSRDNSEYGKEFSIDSFSVDCSFVFQNDSTSGSFHKNDKLIMNFSNTHDGVSLKDNFFVVDSLGYEKVQPTETKPNGNRLNADLQGIQKSGENVKWLYLTIMLIDPDNPMNVFYELNSIGGFNQHDYVCPDNYCAPFEDLQIAK